MHLRSSSEMAGRALGEDFRCEGLGNGRRGGNRTHNPRLRRPVLYPIELLARASLIVAVTAARRTRSHAARAACVSTPQPAA